ncbi:MAG TPA: hypothetical protein VN081_02110, partial [Dongiaceae bacterium]|nr:hypothetical protein [Dongiaceae bacterium]
MPSPKYIQPYGDQLMLMMDDGSQFLAYRTNSTVYLINGTGSSGGGGADGGLGIVANPPSTISAKDTSGTTWTFNSTEIL